MTGSLSVVLGFILYLAVAIVLVRKYLRTRDIGFVWLGTAVVIWPLTCRLLAFREGFLIDHLIRGRAPAIYPFSLVYRGKMTIGGFVSSLHWTEQLIGTCLLLVAVVQLSKQRTSDAAHLR
jgi:uncharacterized membrane protein